MAARGKCRCLTAACGTWGVWRPQLSPSQLVLRRGGTMKCACVQVRQRHHLHNNADNNDAKSPTNADDPQNDIPAYMGRGWAGESGSRQEALQHWARLLQGDQHRLIYRQHAFKYVLTMLCSATAIDAPAVKRLERLAGRQEPTATSPKQQSPSPQ